MDTNLYWGRPGGAGGTEGATGPGGATGVLVLAGSSGRIDTARVDLLASLGVAALGLRWFGGEGLPATPREVPLELFADAIDRLSHDCDRIVLLGLSYGAEAVLLTASIDPRPAAVVALAPTDVAWEGAADSVDDQPRSKWTHEGRPIPFVGLDRQWRPPAGDPAYVDLYLRSRAAAGASMLEAATIPVERIGGEVLLVAGGDDRVWPSVIAAERIAARREAAGRVTSVVTDPRAGHPVVFPGEAATDATRRYQVGGDSGAAQRLGRLAWPHVARLVGVG